MRTFDFETIVKDPAVFADGRLPAHSDHVAFRSEAELAAGESSLRLCLDGVWKFHYANNIQAAPEGFWREDYDTRSWDTIRVPAHIQMEGHGAPAYVNTQYPWDAFQPRGGLRHRVHPARGLPGPFGGPVLPGGGERLCLLAQRDLPGLQRGQLHPRGLLPGRAAAGGGQQAGRPGLQVDPGQLVRGPGLLPLLRHFPQRPSLRPAEDRGAGPSCGRAGSSPPQRP